MSDIQALLALRFDEGEIQQVTVDAEGVAVLLWQRDGEKFLIEFKHHIWFCDTGTYRTGGIGPGSSGTERIEAGRCSEAIKQHVWPYLDQAGRNRLLSPTVKFVAVYSPYDVSPGLAVIVEEADICVHSCQTDRGRREQVRAHSRV